MLKKLFKRALIMVGVGTTGIAVTQAVTNEKPIQSFFDYFIEQFKDKTYLILIGVVISMTLFRRY